MSSILLQLFMLSLN